MKILVTGFDPFGGEKINPAWEAVKSLPKSISGAEIIKVEIPTVFKRSADVIEKEIEKHRPEAVVSVGQAGGRACVTVEQVAINLMEASIPDNDGASPQGLPVREEGETAYFTTLPVKAMVAAAREKGYPSQISYTAGTYVCNSVMYNDLYLAEKKFPGIKAGFIHVPFSHAQVIGKRGAIPSMAIADMAKCIEAMLEAVVCGKEAENALEGTIR